LNEKEYSLVNKIFLKEKVNDNDIIKYNKNILKKYDNYLF